MFLSNGKFHSLEETLESVSMTFSSEARTTSFTRSRLTATE